MNKIDIELRSMIDSLIERFPQLEICRQDIIDGYVLIEEVYKQNGKLLIAGNGGSAADSEHIVGELMKEFRCRRTVPGKLVDKLRAIDSSRGEKLSQILESGLPAISLTTHEALNTAYMNDVDGGGVFAQQLFGYGRPEDAFLAISTSGNSENILLATVTAKALGIKVVALTGNDGGELSRLADVTVIVPETETYLIQELHLPIYHCWCMMLEKNFFGE